MEERNVGYVRNKPDKANPTKHMIKKPLWLVQMQGIRPGARRSMRQVVMVGSFICLVWLTGCDCGDNPIPFPERDSAVTGQNLADPRSHNREKEKPEEVVSRITWPRIVAFGDSLTAGLGVSSDDSYPAQLQRRLNELGYHYQVINAGVSGETTAGGLRRIAWVLKYHPDVVILELGANDGLRGLPITQTFENLRRMIQRLQDDRITVVLAGMKIPPNYGERYASEFASIYRRLAHDFPVTLIPFFLEGVAARPNLNQADGLHPTRDGYTIIVKQLLPVLQPLLKKRAGIPSS